MTVARPSVAAVDFPEAEFRALTTALERRVRLFPVKAAEMAAGSMPVDDVPAVLLRLGAPGCDTTDVLERLRYFFPEQKVCMVVPESGEVPVDDALELDINCHLSAKQALDGGCAQVRRVLTFLLDTVERTLPVRMVEGAAWHHETLVSKGDKLRLSEAIAAQFTRFTSDGAALYRLRLCVEEALNNSIFHAFRNADGSEKYRVSHFQMLAPRDRLDVSFGANKSSFCLAISDNAGTLELPTILDRLNYRDDEANLFAERGRGLFLMRNYSHETYIAVMRAKLTLLMLMFHAEAPEGEWRPLLVRYEEAAARQTA